MVPYHEEPSPGPARPGGMIVRIPSRAEVRELVAEQHRETMAAARRGRNVHQLGLDQKDKLLAYAARLSDAHGDDAATTFLQLVAEETAAVTAHVEQETDLQRARLATQHRLAQEQADREASSGAQIATAVTIFVVVLMMYSCLGL